MFGLKLITLLFFIVVFSQFSLVNSKIPKIFGRFAPNFFFMLILFSKISQMFRICFYYRGGVIILTRWYLVQCKKLWHQSDLKMSNSDIKNGSSRGTIRIPSLSMKVGLWTQICASKRLRILSGNSRSDSSSALPPRPDRIFGKWKIKNV